MKKILLALFLFSIASNADTRTPNADTNTPSCPNGMFKVSSRTCSADVDVTWRRQDGRTDEQVCADQLATCLNADLCGGATSQTGTITYKQVIADDTDPRNPPGGTTTTIHCEATVVCCVEIPF